MQQYNETRVPFACETLHHVWEMGRSHVPMNQRTQYYNIVECVLRTVDKKQQQEGEQDNDDDDDIDDGTYEERKDSDGEDSGYNDDDDEKGDFHHPLVEMETVEYSLSKGRLLRALARDSAQSKYGVGWEWSMVSYNAKPFQEQAFLQVSERSPRVSAANEVGND